MLGDDIDVYRLKKQLDTVDKAQDYIIQAVQKVCGALVKMDARISALAFRVKELEEPNE